MSPLTECKKCENQIWPKDVYKVTPVKNSPPHLALAYECSNCSRRAYVVSTEDEWEEARIASVEPTANEIALRVALFDLDTLETVDELLGYWRSLKNPPIREEVMGSCHCPTCMRRLYGSEED